MFAFNGTSLNFAHFPALIEPDAWGRECADTTKLCLTVSPQEEVRVNQWGRQSLKIQSKTHRSYRGFV